MKLVITGTLPSLNEMINASKSSKYKYVAMKDRAIRAVAWSAVKQLGKIKLAKADYTIHWYCPNKRKDKDNVIAGQKFIFDGLQEAGIITNDGWSQIGIITHIFEVDKNNPRIEVDIA